ncbi:MAG: DoxX family protein [Longimicrobiales bacterium]
MSEHPGTAAKAGTLFLWIITIAAAAGMALAGVAKFTSSEMWTGLFSGWGYPAAFAYVIGFLEVAGALAFLVPRFATYAGTLIALIMSGAVITILVHDSGMQLSIPATNLVVFAAVAFLRRDLRWTPGAGSQG